MITKAHLILYVSDQRASAAFYAKVLGLKPRLDVPGMTEFELDGGAVLGLMPQAGIKRLLGDKLPDPAKAGGDTTRRTLSARRRPRRPRPRLRPGLKTQTKRAGSPRKTDGKSVI